MNISIHLSIYLYLQIKAKMQTFFAFVNIGTSIYLYLRKQVMFAST